MIHIVPDFLVEIPILRFYRKLIGTFRISFCSLMFLCSVFFVLFYHFLLYLISYRSVLCWSSAGTKEDKKCLSFYFRWFVVTLKEMIWWCIQRQSVIVPEWSPVLCFVCRWYGVLSSCWLLPSAWVSTYTSFPPSEKWKSHVPGYSGKRWWSEVRLS